MTSTKTPPTGETNRVFILGVVGVIVLGLAAVAWAATRGGDDTSPGTETAADGAATDGDAASDDADGTDAAADADGGGDQAETASVEVVGDAIVSMERGEPVVQREGEAAVGTIAPKLVGTGFDGSEIVIEADGRPKVVYFVAHWCPHCQREVPALVDLIGQGKKPEGLDLYAVSTAVDDGGPNFPPSEWIAAEGVEFPVMRDDEAATALTAYGPSGFPYAVYLDGDNRVVAQSAGELDEATITELWAATVG